MTGPELRSSFVGSVNQQDSQTGWQIGVASFEALFLFQSIPWAKEQSLKLASIRSRTEDSFQVPSGLDAKPIAEPGAPSGFIFREGV